GLRLSSRPSVERGTARDFYRCLAPVPKTRETRIGRAPGEGEPDLRGRRRIYRVEDQPPRGDRHPTDSVAEAASAADRDQALAAPADVRGGSLARATAAAKAPTVKGLRSSSLLLRSSLSLSPT